jgi:hypothetical protein
MALNIFNQHWPSPQNLNYGFETVRSCTFIPAQREKRNI